jgi:hypothetical protein
LLLASSAPVPAAELANSDASYVLSRGMLTLGKARFTLKAVPERADCYQYEYHAEPQGLARLVIGQLKESSRFCLVEGALRSEHFEFTRSDKPEDSFKLDFDWNKRVVRSSKGELRQLTEDMSDRLALQIAIQRWVIAQKGQPGPAEISITQVEDDRAKTYRFRIMARETLQVPAGSFETVRVERVDNPKKATRFWLAPARGYGAVRVEQIKGGDEQFKMVLSD